MWRLVEGAVRIARWLTALLAATRHAARRVRQTCRKALRRKTIRTFDRVEALGFNSTSTLLLAVAILTALLATGFRPTTTFPSAITHSADEQIVVRIKSDSPRGTLRVAQTIYTSPSPSGEQCWSGLRLGLGGDLLTSASSWDALFPGSSASSVDVGTAKLSEPDDAEAILDPVPESDVSINPIMSDQDPQQLEQTVIPFQMTARPTLMQQPGGLLSTDLDWSSDVQSRTSRRCAGLRNHILSGRGPYLSLTAPQVTLELTSTATDGPQPGPRSAPSVVLDTSLSLVGTDDYKVEVGPEPVATTSTFGGQQMTWTQDAFTAKTSTASADSDTHYYQSLLPSVTAESPSRKSIEDRNVFIGGILLGLAGASLVGCLQEVLNTRRQRKRSPTPVESSLAHFFLEEQSPQLGLHIARSSVRLDRWVSRAVGVTFAAFLASLSLPLVSPYMLEGSGLLVVIGLPIALIHASLLGLLVLIKRTRAAGSTGFARVVVRSAGLFGIASLVMWIMLVGQLGDTSSEQPTSAGGEILSSITPATTGLFMLSIASIWIKVAHAARWRRLIRAILAVGSVAIAGLLLFFAVVAYFNELLSNVGIASTVGLLLVSVTLALLLILAPSQVLE